MGLNLDSVSSVTSMRGRIRAAARGRFRIHRSCIVGAFLVLCGATASAQTLCIPPASGVPALGGAPQWWNSSVGEPNYWPRLDDPRWRGALARGFGTGANEDVSFRALRDSNNLYLSWYVKVDPQLDPFIDSVRVAFSPGGTAPDELIQVFPFTSASSSLVAAVPPSTTTQLRTGAGGHWVTKTSEPTWLATSAGFTRVWLDVPNQQWAINMRVPIAAAYNDGINLSGNFRLWFEVQVGLPSGGVTYYRLGSLTHDDITNGTSASGWPEFSRTLAASDPSCEQGVSLTPAHVGTRNVDSGGTPRPNQINVFSPNTFFAEPTNNTGSPIPAGRIQATFRIANWGTQVNWNDVTDPTNSLWKQISPGTVTNANTIADGQTATQGANNDIHFAYTLDQSPGNNETCAYTGQTGQTSFSGYHVDGNPACPNVEPTRRLHQCILVTLSGGGYTYTPASVYRNMDYVDASKFRRRAQVSVAGVAPISGTTRRNVYLYVKTYNMPRDTSAKRRPDLLRNYTKLRQVVTRPVPGDNEEFSATHMAMVSPRGARLAPIDPSKIPSRPPIGVPFHVLNQLYPTYVVYAYRDTGKTVMVRGHVRHVLKPQSSFGYYVHHAGALTGWDTLLAGAHEVAPDYYLVAVPNGGSKQISTGVTARTQPREECGCFNLSCLVKKK